jgi:hypothetical protein
MSLDIETVSKIFPEAKISNASGHIEYVVHCRKFHKKGGKYKLSINADTGVFMCNDCGWCGNAFNEFFDEGNQFFAGLQVYRPTNDFKFNNTFHNFNTEEWIDGIPKPGTLIDISGLNNDHPAIIYLADRGVDKNLASLFQVKYCQNGLYNFSSRLGTTSGRIIFPVYVFGKLVGWQARQIDKTDSKSYRYVWKGEEIGWWKPHKIILSDGTKTYADYEVPKYYTCPGMQRSRALFNFDQAVSNTDYTIVVEGPIDCIKVGKNCVATFGKKITKDQIRILKSNWSKIILLLDTEVNTQENWFNELEKSFDGVYFRYMKLSGYNDPGEATTKEIWKQIKENIRNKN